MRRSLLRRISFVCFIAAAAGIGAPATAAQAPPVMADPAASPEDIVITGDRGTAASPLDDVRAIIAEHDGQMARFETAICPLVRGLSGQHRQIIEQRIRDLALGVGLRVGQPGCAPNLALLIAADGAGTVAALKKRRPNLFAALGNAELNRLNRSAGPVWNWYAIDPKRRDGGPVEFMTQIAMGDGPPRSAGRNAYIASNVVMSRLSEPVRFDLALSFIVIDIHSIEGLTLGQIGDFAAMLGLSKIRYDNIDLLRRASILRVFADRAAGRRAASAATAFDLAHLRGLYAGEAGLSYDRQSARIAQRARRNARGQAPEEGRESDR